MEFASQSIMEESATQREGSMNLQQVPLRYLTSDDLYAYKKTICGQNTLKRLEERIPGAQKVIKVTIAKRQTGKPQNLQGIRYSKEFASTVKNQLQPNKNISLVSLLNES